MPIDKVCQQFEGKNKFTFKMALGQLCIDTLLPIQKKMEYLRNDRFVVINFLTNLKLYFFRLFVDKVIQNGAEQAREIAQSNLQKIKEIIGFV